MYIDLSLLKIWVLLNERKVKSFKRATSLLVDKLESLLK